MAGRRDSDPKPTITFSYFVEKYRSTGSNVLGEKRFYVSYRTLESHWERDNIVEALKAVSPDLAATSISTIEQLFLRTFSTLVYSQKLGYFQKCFIELDMHDEALPLGNRPHQWLEAPVHADLFTNICLHQWLFFPLIFDPHHLQSRRLHNDHVLPILERTTLYEDTTANVYLILIDDEYNKLVEKGPDGKPVQQKFVLKTYHKDCFDLFTNEVEAYTKLQNTPSENIIRHYGSFIQADKYSLILEYADGETLDDLLKGVPPPQTSKDILLFWTSYFGFLRGAHRIHQILLPTETFHGLHGDIKPDNMLLQKGKSGSPYEFTAKIADFGYSHFRPVKKGEQDELGLDRHGNQVYSAPEASRHTRFLLKGPHRVDYSTDIFSIGCVTSSVITWMARGDQGREAYFRQRQEATSRIRTFMGAGYDGCFHNGVEILPEVKQMHQLVLQELQPNDKITPRVIEIVEKYMLSREAGSRWTAKKLNSQFEINYEDASMEMFPPSTQVSNPERVCVSATFEPSAIRTRETGISSHSDPLPRHRVLLCQLRTWKKAKKRNRFDAEFYEVDKTIQKLSGYVRGRDHIFLVDDSHSMNSYKQNVIDAFGEFSYTAKQMDPDGIELVFASASNKVYKNKRTSKLTKILANHCFESPSDMMECHLGDFFDSIRPRLRWSQKKMSIFVFTDGRWGNGGNAAGGVEKPMKDLMQWVVTQEIKRTKIMISFVQFGESGTGKRYLEFLDNCGRSPEFKDVHGRSKSCDIVDTGRVDGNIVKLFVGSISEENDEDCDD